MGSQRLRRVGSLKAEATVHPCGSRPAVPSGALLAGIARNKVPAQIHAGRGKRVR